MYVCYALTGLGFLQHCKLCKPMSEPYGGESRIAWRNTDGHLSRKSVVLPGELNPTSDIRKPDTGRLIQ